MIVPKLLHIVITAARVKHILLFMYGLDMTSDCIIIKIDIGDGCKQTLQHGSVSMCSRLFPLGRAGKSHKCAGELVLQV